MRKRKGPGQKPRAIIVKFTRYKDWHHVFRNKKLLKGTGISVTESLTLTRMEHLKKAREQHGFANFRTLDRKIILREMTVIQKFIILKWFSHNL